MENNKITIEYIMSIKFNETQPSSNGIYYIECNNEGLYRCYHKSNSKKITVIKDVLMGYNL